jgi:DUF971 family protein
LNTPPQKIEIVGDFLALIWHDNEEIILDSQTLRKNSPSAEQGGERDIFGHIHGGSAQKDFTGVKLQSYEKVGNYAVRLLFSDGHGSGIYSWELLRSLS